MSVATARRLKVRTRLCLVLALPRAGFDVIRVRGRHHDLRHDDARSTVVPVHAGEIIGPGLMAATLRDCDRTREAFSALLQPSARTAIRDWLAGNTVGSASATRRSGRIGARREFPALQYPPDLTIENGAADCCTRRTSMADDRVGAYHRCRAALSVSAPQVPQRGGTSLGLRSFAAQGLTNQGATDDYGAARRSAGRSSGAQCRFGGVPRPGRAVRG
jgi:predicted RNA binding protein YcfA (HicA-like mRNA interferase family)